MIHEIRPSRTKARETTSLRTKVSTSHAWKLISSLLLTLIFAVALSAQSAPAVQSTTDVLITVAGEVEHPLKLTRT